jgi:hypothetical protein
MPRTVAVSIITRDGEERLPRVLGEAATFADEKIVGVDAGSRDPQGR